MGGVNQATIQPLAGLSTDTAAESFGDLYERTFDRVYAYVQSMLRDAAAAEDVTSQAFERAYRKRRSYKPGRGTAEAWLFGIARNAALDERARRKRHARMATEPEDVDAQPPDDLADTALRRATVRAAMEPAGATRARAGLAEVPGGADQRRDREGGRHLGVQHLDPPEPDHDQAAGGLP